jgi:Acyl-CoA dehydrogenase, C-terminal domain.
MLGDLGAIANADRARDAGLLTPATSSLLETARGINADMFFRRASTIYGGTSEVQRGIVARHLFGF